MKESLDDKHNGHDNEFYEDIDEEEMHELVWEAQREALLKAAQEKEQQKTKRKFPKWIFWLMAIVLGVNTFSIIFEIYSIPAIDFLRTSAELSSDEKIALYKKSVVVISTEDSKGTGFSISSDGTILTNYHVIEGNETVSVYFPDDGRYSAKVIEEYPSIDLAVLKVDSKNLPFLKLSEEKSFIQNEPIQFIGNPLRFHGIANEGTIIEPIQLKDWEEEVIMIKAPVYRGNSGSPILNENGLVIGIIFATLNHEDFGKVGLFIPIDYYLRTLNSSAE
ncbi:S1C family serine protease [Sporosarcina siberiensis]|uniref:S1C family serine protease n=1 Tax=Sporosarcina siberiensis TaxID=1365606 RepID=A0ABW4SFC1_9BACL